MKRDLERCRLQYINEANSVGIEYIGEADSNYKNSYRKYKLTCGHEVNLIPSNVRVRSFKCKDCLDSKLNEESELVGLKLLSKIKSKFYLYELPCGHQQELFSSAVRTNEWKCRKCHLTYFDKPSFIYLIKIKHQDFTWLKLGYSNNIKVRFRSYKLLDGSEIETLQLVSMSDGYSAIKEEQRLHSKYFNSRLNPELMKNFHNQDGYSECYPIEMLEILSKEVKSLEIQLQ